MIETSDLVTGPNLPDGTAASQRPEPASGTDAGAGDLKRGYLTVPTERIPLYSRQDDGGENPVGDPFTYGGFLGRPQGNQR